MAKKKVYAVRKGKKTGLFQTWGECQAAVHGFSGAEYKSFSTEEEALAFLNHTEESFQEEEDHLIIYIDGSFSKEIGKYSYGCMILTPEGKIFRESGNGSDPESLAIRNVAGEMLGAMHAVQWTIQNGYTAVELCYDYEGIEKWATGKWKTNNRLTREYAAYMQEKQKTIKIVFTKVKAHSGNHYNEEVDKLAKAALVRKYKRIFVIVMDSLGVGEMPDAAAYGDAGTNTFGHIWERMDGLKIPNLRKLGMGDLCQVTNDRDIMGYHMKLRETSKGKDTMTGHWEMMGIYTTKPFRTFTEHGFPPELIEELEKRCGRKIIGNKAASGTEILKELGEQEIANGELIVYTSADSVLQICGNEETMGLENLYHYCEIARELTLREEWKVGRVIARPYIGRTREEFKRTSNRRDYALKPERDTVLDLIKEKGYDVIGIGKISDIFAGCGITESLHSDSSVHGMQQTIETAQRDFCGLTFTNLVDFDALWGHRRDPVGYGKEIERFDDGLGRLLPLLGKDDLLMITADHGNDPTHTGTDHTRERVPLLVYSPSMTGAGALEEQESFGVIGATIADNYDIELPDYLIGTSLMDKLK